MNNASRFIMIIILTSSSLLCQQKDETVKWRATLEKSISTEKGREILNSMLDTFDRESRSDGRSFPQWAIDASVWYDARLAHHESFQRSWRRLSPGAWQLGALGVSSLLVLMIGKLFAKDSTPILLAWPVLIYSALFYVAGYQADSFLTAEGQNIRYDIVRAVLAEMKERGMLFDEKAKLRISELCAMFPSPYVIQFLHPNCATYQAPTPSLQEVLSKRNTTE